MAKKTTEERVVFPDPLDRDKDWTIQPSWNPELLLWITLLGLPMMLLFMIYAKLNPVA